MNRLKHLLSRANELYYSTSIRSRLSLSFALLFAVLLVLLVIIVNNVSSSILIGKAVDNTSQSIALVSEKFDLTFDRVEDYAKTAITNNDIQDVLTVSPQEDELSRYTSRIKVFSALDGIINQTLIDSMHIYDYHRRMFDSGSVQNVQYRLPEFYDFFRTLESAGQLRWIDTHPSNYTKLSSVQHIVTLVRGIIDAGSGRRIGVLETNVSERTIAGLYDGIRLGNSGKIFVVNERGMIVSHADKHELYASVADQPYYEWIEKNNGGKTFGINGEEFLVISRHYERLNWTIVGIVPTVEILQDQKRLTNRLLSIGFIFLAISVFITILLSNSITRPILKLKQTMKFVSGGDLGVRAEVKYKDEIGTLTNEFNRMIRNTSELMDDLLDKRKKEEEYELALLQSQVNPHFLYNTLESINGLAELNRNGEIIRLVNELAFFYRGVLSKGSKIISLKEELDITESYLKMLKIRHGDRLNYRIEVDESLYGYATVKLLLQPLVENALIHGLRNKRGPGTIRIIGAEDSDLLYLFVIDDGIGMEAEAARSILLESPEGERKSGFGLASTNKRIKLYFGESYGLRIESGPEGTKVEISLPKNEMWKDDAS
ncbi:sensor histidine kinase [Cohnella terricola]|uniref:Sensor histidine kinase n=1 Tax=Cohnella terricola TaxID=1289167 RepID=A0A559JN31_9BACL|nr:sensor histidine kinase [Cohnella terricola]TVY01276.1 sensor histidine kinase [Cohnella terricola]